jgi:hypothetical protein
MLSPRKYVALLCLFVVALPGIVLSSTPSNSTDRTYHAPAVVDYFHCLWQARGLAGGHRPVVLVRVASERELQGKSPQAEVEVLHVFGQSGEQVPQAGPLLIPTYSDQEELFTPGRYLILHVQLAATGKPPIVRDREMAVWPMSASNYLWIEGVTSRKQVLAIEVPAPDSPVVAAISELLFGMSLAGRRVDPGERFFHYIQTDDADLQMLAAQVACVNGIHLRPEQADRYARVLLAEPDADLRQELAKLYLNSTLDVLPRDDALLGRLLCHSDTAIAEMALLGGVARLDDIRRQQKVAETVGAILDRPEEAVRQSGAALAALAFWGQGAAMLEPTLRDIAFQTRAEWPSRHRQLAVQLLLDHCPDQRARILDTLLLEFPNALTMYHAVRANHVDVVPALLAGVENGDVAWNGPASMAVRALTGRQHWTRAEEFLDWWNQQVQTGRADALLRDGFVLELDEAQLGDTIRRLGGREFQTRQEARQRLICQSGIVPPTLMRACKNRNPQVALAAREVVRSLQAGRGELVHQLREMASVQRRAAITPVAFGDSHERNLNRLRLLNGLNWNKATELAMGE